MAKESASKAAEDGFAADGVQVFRKFLSGKREGLMVKNGGWSW